MHKSIGEVLAARRKELGLSQAELAGRLGMLGVGVTNQAVSKWEKGATEPGAEQLLALCEALDIEDVRGAFISVSEGLFRGLNYEGRRKALEYVELLRLSGRYSPAAEGRGELRSLPLYSLAVSAGTGQFLD